MLNWKQWKQSCLIHSKSLRFKNRIKQVNELILKVLENANNPTIAFSGGKDSTVIYHLVKDIAPDINCHYWDDEFILKETSLYLERIGDVKIKYHKGKHTEWFITNQEKKETLIEFDTVFIGLRAEENGYRKKYLAKYGLCFYAKKFNQILCNPIGWWKLEDVWAYIFSTKRDYNKVYEIMASKGIDYEFQRVGPFANWRAIQYGQINILKLCFPEEYNKFITKYPIAKSYA